MARDDNVLKGRKAERVAQGLRDFLTAHMMVPVARAGFDPEEHVDVVFESETEGDTTTVKIGIVGNLHTPYKEVDVTMRFEHN